MHHFCRSDLADHTLLRAARTHLSLERTATADLLADLAEIDTRKLYLSAGYPSLFAWCMAELHLSEQAAYRRILAARTGRRFPEIFPAVAEGRLHLTAVGLLAPHLTENTAEELLSAATHKTKAEIEKLLAERFPRPDLPARIVSVSRMSPGLVGPLRGQLSPAIVPAMSAPVAGELSPAIVPDSPPPPALHQAEASPVPGHHVSRSAGEHPKVTPLSPGRYGVQFTIGQHAHDLLQHALNLLGHQIRSGDLAQVFERALEALVRELEKSKFAATEKPRHGVCHSTDRPMHLGIKSRHIPAKVRRAVWERDEGRCTFVSETGHRCPARTPLEFDHVLEVAHGGDATVSGIRLRCRAHNQYQAERTFGAQFMRNKRLAAQEARAAKRKLDPAKGGESSPGWSP